MGPEKEGRGPKKPLELTPGTLKGLIGRDRPGLKSNLALADYGETEGKLTFQNFRFFIS